MSARLSLMEQAASELNTDCENCLFTVLAQRTSDASAFCTRGWTSTELLLLQACLVFLSTGSGMIYLRCVGTGISESCGGICQKKHSRFLRIVTSALLNSN